MPTCTGGICSPRYYLRDTTEECVSCSVERAWLGPVIFFFLLLMVGATVFWHRKRLTILFEKYEDVLTDAGHRLTLIFITMQIIVLLQSNHTAIGGSTFPDPYERFLRACRFMTLDLVQLMSFDCMYVV